MNMYHKKRWRVQVKMYVKPKPGQHPGHAFVWKDARNSQGGVYTYKTEAGAMWAAEAWGDAWLLGDIRLFQEVANENCQR